VVDIDAEKAAVLLVEEELEDKLLLPSSHPA
jgi:hypothetical protein